MALNLNTTWGYERTFQILLRGTGTGVTGPTRTRLTRAKTRLFGHLRPTLLRHIPKAFAHSSKYVGAL